MDDSGILSLSRPTSAQLRSALVIPSFPQILSELVQNSLDAKATRISCQVDLSPGCGSIRVEDDGHGMALSQLDHVGVRNASSKQTTTGARAATGSYGFRGEACLGLLEISSRTAACHRTMTKIVKHGVTLYVGESSRPLDRAQGTTVTVRDLFDKIPVRQARLSATPAQTLTACRKVIEELALIHPTVVWTLYEVRAVGVSADHGVKKVLAVGPNRAAQEAFRCLYGGGLVERVQKVRVSTGMIRIDGFIALEGLLSKASSPSLVDSEKGLRRKAHQHLYINHFPLERGELQSSISQRFAASRFSLLASCAGSEEEPGRGLRRSPRRLERFPIYVLDISIAADELDTTYDPKKTIMSVKETERFKALLLAVVDQFLDKHGYAATSTTKAGSQSPSRSRSTPVESLQAGFHPPSSRPQSAMPCRPQQNQVGCEVSTTATSPTPRIRGQNQLGPIKAVPIVPIDRRRADWIEEIIADTDPGLISGQQDMLPAYRATHHSSVRASAAQDIVFQRHDLMRARVIRQIDHKFICCSIRSSREDSEQRTTLVLLDQHAADERISVNSVLSELCAGFQADSVPVTDLPEPRPLVLLGREEAETFIANNVKAILHRWGIRVELVSRAEHTADRPDFAQLRVHAVPTAFHSRLGRMHPSEMTRLIGLLLQDADSVIPATQSYLASISDADDPGDWTRVLGFMPKEMLELANSKACRNAIMFGDRLTTEQCGRLIRQLAETKQPFICAHGRPSLVPTGLIPLNPRSNRPLAALDWAAYKQRRPEHTVPIRRSPL